jgi:threonine aldolase
MIARLAQIDDAESIAADDYSRGGVVERLETTLAADLGKEAAIFFATGTLANLLALRQHCWGRGQRVLVPEQSHVYNDTGDGATLLAGLNLIPLGVGRPGFCFDEVVAAIDRAGQGRVATPVGALLIESPVRRQAGRIVDFDEIRAITSRCRERDVRTHLDGARLYMMAAATGIGVRTYAALFDSVYVSLWKYFGAPFGAILAGDRALIDGLYHQRRLFGGGVPSSALPAALVLDGLPGFAARFSAAIARARDLFAALGAPPFPDGSNIFPLPLPAGLDRARFVAALAADDISIAAPDPAADRALLTVNTTILRRPTAELLGAFERALA